MYTIFYIVLGTSFSANLQYCIVCFCKNFWCGIYFVSTIPLIFGGGNTIDGAFHNGPDLGIMVG